MTCSSGTEVNGKIIPAPGTELVVKFLFLQMHPKGFFSAILKQWLWNYSSSGLGKLLPKNQFLQR